MTKSSKIKVGGMAPDFGLPDQDGRFHKLSDYRGGWVLLYFYPKDDTPGCTKEACTIRDFLPDFEKLDVAVLGVSADSVKSHKQFAEKYDLSFTLLADDQRVVIKLYGAWSEKKKGTLRQSCLIDPVGKIRKIYKNVKPETHAEEVLQDVKK